MDDEDDSYGFGSFAELFDGGSAPSAPPLDARAVRRFWADERMLAAFAQLPSPPREFAHAAAKFDGAAVDGGLGSACVAPSWAGDRRGGLLWRQPRQSDSNVLARRKKELQDITNQRPASVNEGESGGAKSASAVFIPVADIEDAALHAVQSARRGISFRLRGGTAFELVFMPGPFAKANDCDELLALVTQAMAAPSPDSVDAAPAASDTTPRAPLDAAPESWRLESCVKQPSTPVASDASATSSSPRRPPAKTQRGSVVSRYLARGSPAPKAESAPDHERAHPEDGPKAKEELRELIRTYLALDELSDEAIALAQKIHALSGYQVGPRAKALPQFSSDPVYKKNTVAQLSKFLDKMNREWEQAERERERITGAKAARSRSDGFEYTDALTGDRIPAAVYQETYLKRMGCDQIDPVLRLLPVCASPPAASAAASAARDDGDSAGSELSSATATSSERLGGAPTVSSKGDRATARKLSALLGVDVTQSCVIDETFYTRAALGSDDSRGVEEAREEMWRSWEAALSRFLQQRQSTLARADGSQPRPGDGSDDASAPADTAADTRTRARDRPWSIVAPAALSALKDVRASTTSPVDATRSGSKIPVYRGAKTSSGSKRRRPDEAGGPPIAPDALDAARQLEARRKARRQSIVGDVRIDLCGDADDEDPAKPTLEPPSEVVAAGEEEKEEAKAEEAKAEDAVCALCCDARVTVRMHPCDHAVCETCWRRLAPASEPPMTTGGSGARLCPWDRELVTQRSQ